MKNPEPGPWNQCDDLVLTGIQYFDFSGSGWSICDDDCMIGAGRAWPNCEIELGNDEETSNLWGKHSESALMSIGKWMVLMIGVKNYELRGLNYWRL